MELFKPSKRILETICADNKLITQYTVFPPNSSEEALEDTIRTGVSGLIYQVAEYYRWSLDIRKNMNTQRFGEVFGEALTNAISHGSKNKYLVFYGLFMGDKGVCHGFKDRGYFFRREDIKRKFESKEHPKEFNKGLEGFSGGKYGIDLIFDSSDIIEVDTKKGVLYCVQFKENLRKM